jgi:hypothetical protein
LKEILALNLESINNKATHISTLAVAQHQMIKDNKKKPQTSIDTSLILIL